MMEKIRKVANSIVVKIIFGIIILSFILTGVGGFLGLGLGNSNNEQQLYIAKIDGEGISRSAFESYASERSRSIQTSNLEENDKQTFIKEVRKNALDVQVNNYLVYRLAKSLSTRVGDEQVKNAIRGQKIFFEDNKFSNKLYLELLINNGYTPEQYAEEIRSSLVPEQLLNALFSSEFVLPIDSNISILQKQERTAYIANFDSSLALDKALTFSEEELKQYYQSHQSDFHRPERVKLKYVTNFRPNIIPLVNVTDAEIKQEYQKNLKRKYSFPAKRLYSIINVQNRADANAIVKKLKEGADFNILATKSKALSPYGNSNGSLGWFSIDDTLPTFLAKSGLNKKNAVSKPIKTDDGYVIVKLNDIVPAQPMTLDYVSPSIRKDLAIAKENAMYDKKEQKLKTALAKKPKSIAELAQLSQLPEIDSDWNYYNEPFGIVRFPEVKEVVFSERMIKDNKPTGEISGIVISSQYDSSFVLQVTDYRSEGIAPFDEVKDDIMRSLKDQVARQSFSEFIAKLKEDFVTNGHSDKLSFSNRHVLTREGNGNVEAAVLDSIFSEIPSATNKTLYIVDKLDETRGIAVALTRVENGQYTDISQQVFPTILNSQQRNFIEQLRSNVKIDIMPNANL